MGASRVRVVGSIAMSFCLFACEGGRLDRADSDAKKIATALAYARKTKVGYCPSPEALRANNDLSDAVPIVDPWGREFFTECASSVVTVRSAGPDKKLGTKDDIAVTAVGTPASSTGTPTSLPAFTRAPDPPSAPEPPAVAMHPECLGCRRQRMQCAIDVKAGRLPDGFESLPEPIEGCVLQYSACLQIVLENEKVTCPR